MIQRIGRPGKKDDSPITRVVDSVLKAQSDHAEKAPAVVSGHVAIAQKRTGKANEARATVNDEYRPLDMVRNEAAGNDEPEPAGGRKEN